MSLARVRAIAIVSGLVVCALVLVTLAILKDTQTNVGPTRDCPKDAVLANAKLPADEKNVKINVYNATDQANLATNVANDFRGRKFNVVEVGNDPLGRKVDGVAVLRYGPKTVGSAWLLRAYFLGEAATEFDIKRDDDVVDVVIGNGFRQIGTITEVKQSLAQLGSPTTPKGTCAVKA